MINKFSLTGKVALVTGATGYLGRSIAIGLAELGALVLVHGRTPDKVNMLVSEIRQQGLLAEPVIFDITQQTEIMDFFKNFKYDGLDILVNNAYAGVGGTVETATTSEYEESYASSVIASHNLLQKSLELLRSAVAKHGDASVINIASMYGVVSPDLGIYSSAKGSNPPFYGAAKAALIQFTRYAACEFAKEKIRVNAISPGPFPSVSTQENMPELVQKIEEKVPMGRIGQPDELKSAVCFLASPAASYITGVNLPVDGGWTCW